MSNKKLSRKNHANEYTPEQIVKFTKELKDTSNTSLDYILIKNFHKEIVNVDNQSFLSLLNFDYNIKNVEEIFKIDYKEEKEDNLGYFIWKKLKESNIDSLNSEGIPDSTLNQIIENKMPIWDLGIEQIKSLIKSLRIDVKKFLTVVSNFDLTMLNIPYNTNVLARLGSSLASEDKLDLIEEGSYELFIARQERKREKFLKESRVLL